MLTIDKEKMYIRKLDDLHRRYEALRDRAMKLELGEVPPKRLAALLKDVHFHVSVGIRWYKMKLEDASTPEAERRAIEGNYKQAKECQQFTEWLVGQMK